MSKRTFKKYTKLAKVIAVPGMAVRNQKGEIVKQFYNIYKM